MTMERLSKYSWDPYDTPEPEPVMICSECGEGIYEGEPFWRINGDCICEKCMDDKKDFA